MLRPSDRSRAFTLVEVLIVVAIIAMVAAVVVPQMLSAGTMQAQAAGRMLIADILFAQSDSVARQSVRRLVFDVPNNRYRLADAQDQTLAASWQSGAQYAVDLSRDRRFAGVRLESAEFGESSTLEFDDMGAPLSGGTIELTGGGHRYRIQVAPFTGRVTIDRVSGG